jgi:hypothetical protein
MQSPQIAPQGKRCPRCERVQPLAARFCAHCGGEFLLGAPTPAPKPKEKQDLLCYASFFIGLLSIGMIPMGFAALGLIQGIWGLQRAKGPGYGGSRILAWIGIAINSGILCILASMIFQQLTQEPRQL